VTKTELKSLYRSWPSVSTLTWPARYGSVKHIRLRMAKSMLPTARGDLASLRRHRNRIRVATQIAADCGRAISERDRLDALVVKLRQDIAELNATR